MRDLKLSSLRPGTMSINQYKLGCLTVVLSEETRYKFTGDENSKEAIEDKIYENSLSKETWSKSTGDENRKEAIEGKIL
jgi:hypothetical protein